MGIDRPDDPDVPPDHHSDRPAGGAPAETRYRQEYDAELRAAVEERAEPTARSKAAVEQAENRQQPQATSWEQTAELSRWMWTEYKRRWPAEERPPVDRSKDPPGSWHGEGGRVLTVESLMKHLLGISSGSSAHRWSLPSAVIY